MSETQYKIIEEHFQKKRPLLHLARELDRDYSLLWRERQALIEKAAALTEVLEQFDIPINVAMGMLELTEWLTKRHKDIVHSIVLFGSYVRGDHTTSSDVDVALIVEKEIPRVGKLESNLSKKYDVGFSLMQFSPARFKEEVENETVLLLNISADSIAFYDDGTFRRNMVKKPSSRTILTCARRAKERYSDLKRALSTLKGDESIPGLVTDFGYLIGLQLSHALLLLKGVLPRSKYMVFRELEERYPELTRDANVLIRCMQYWDGHPVKLPGKGKVLGTLDKLMELCDRGVSKIGAQKAQEG